MNVYCFMAHRQLRSFSAHLNFIIHVPWVNKPVLGQKMCLAQGHSTMTELPRLGIEPGTPGFEIPDANHSTTADSLTKEEIAKNKQILLLPQFFLFQSQVIHSIIEIFYFLTKYVQSRLLQNCCIREMVNSQQRTCLYKAQSNYEFKASHAKQSAEL